MCDPKGYGQLKADHLKGRNGKKDNCWCLTFMNLGFVSEIRCRTLTALRISAEKPVEIVMAMDRGVMLRPRGKSARGLAQEVRFGRKKQDDDRNDYFGRYRVHREK